jgi:uncharacterized membrane protein AbrB (regulator of aidB expression)
VTQNRFGSYPPEPGASIYTSVAIGTLIGPGAAGSTFDRSHSYTLPILVSIVANILDAGIVAATAKAPVPRNRA